MSKLVRFVAIVMHLQEAASPDEARQRGGPRTEQQGRRRFRRALGWSLLSGEALEYETVCFFRQVGCIDHDGTGQDILEDERGRGRTRVGEVKEKDTGGRESSTLRDGFFKGRRRGVDRPHNGEALAI